MIQNFSNMTKDYNKRLNPELGWAISAQTVTSDSRKLASRGTYCDSCFTLWCFFVLFCCFVCWWGKGRRSKHYQRRELPRIKHLLAEQIWSDTSQIFFFFLENSNLKYLVCIILILREPIFDSGNMITMFLGQILRLRFTF